MKGGCCEWWNREYTKVNGAEEDRSDEFDVLGGVDEPGNEN